MTLDFELIHEDSCRKAVLLFHGMTGSPFELKKYGQFLYANGYDVYADCLPGHGDKVEEIYTVEYKDWLDFAYQRFEYLKSRYDEDCVKDFSPIAIIPYEPRLCKEFITAV